MQSHPRTIPKNVVCIQCRTKWVSWWCNLTEYLTPNRVPKSTYLDQIFTEGAHIPRCQRNSRPTELVKRQKIVFWEFTLFDQTTPTDWDPRSNVLNGEKLFKFSYVPSIPANYLPALARSVIQTNRIICCRPLSLRIVGGIHNWDDIKYQTGCIIFRSGSQQPVKRDGYRTSKLIGIRLLGWQSFTLLYPRW